MASLTAAASSSVAVVPGSFSGLRAEAGGAGRAACHGGGSSSNSTPLPRRLRVSASASVEATVRRAAASVAMVAATGALLAGSAVAAKVEVGDEVGSFKFTPDYITVAAGEPIKFELVGETGHNVVFDVPAGAPAAVASELAANSMGENDLLSEDESSFTAKLSSPGTYTYFCTPHKSANMKGTIIVK